MQTFTASRSFENFNMGKLRPISSFQTTETTYIHVKEKARVRVISSRFALNPDTDRELRKYYYQMYKNGRQRLIEKPVKPASHYEMAGRAQKELNDYLEALRAGNPQKAKAEFQDLINTLALLGSQSDHLVEI